MFIAPFWGDYVIRWLESGVSGRGPRLYVDLDCSFLRRLIKSSQIICYVECWKHWILATSNIWFLRKMWWSLSCSTFLPKYTTRRSALDLTGCILLSAPWTHARYNPIPIRATWKQEFRLYFLVRKNHAILIVIDHSRILIKILLSCLDLGFWRPEVNFILQSCREQWEHSCARQLISNHVL